MANYNGAPPQGNPRGRVGNAVGWLVDKILPGNQYNRNTGSYSNIGSGIAGLVGDAIVPGAGTILQGKWENRNAGQPSPMTFTNFGKPENFGMNVGNVGQPAMSGGIGALHGSGFGPSPFTPAGYNFANPGPSSQSPGGFSNGIFNGGSGNFGPSPSFGGPVTGGGGNRGALNFGGYDSQAHMDASINATQEGMQAARSASPNNRQAGGDIRGNRYQF